ncbi:MAG TPA: MogA/MoaB family molybdenum cofactor biosynthesis protein [bacterium]|nr:MogA/MoaB family molybdenum cofactor biosynthesis protein [bacterium]
MLENVRFALIITSDRAADGRREDATAPLLKSAIVQARGICAETIVIPDDPGRLREQLLRLSSMTEADVILTSGGTGIGPRDITVDVTRALIEKELPGFGEEMRRRSLEKTPYAILSRATAGILRGKLVLNLPGSPRGAVECLEWVMRPIAHAVRILRQLDTDCAPPPKA